MATTRANHRLCAGFGGHLQDYELWRDLACEYADDRLAIDVINGGPALRAWVDDPEAAPADPDGLARADEQSWSEEREAFLLYH